MSQGLTKEDIEDLKKGPKREVKKMRKGTHAHRIIVPDKKK